MSDFYDEFADLADSMLEEYGRPIVLRRVSPGNYNPETGKSLTVTTDYPAPGLINPYSRQRVDGDLVRAEDLQVYVAATALPVAPDAASDRMVIGSKTYSIVSVRETNPGGTAIMYELQGRMTI